MFSEQNKDDITRRPIEIAAIGTAIISKNTKSMKEVFKENKEAIYLTTQTNVLKNVYLLKNTKLLNRISNNANNRVKKLKISNDDLIKKLSEEFKMAKIKYILTHPIQYQVPLIRYLTTKGIDLTVLYRSNFNLNKHLDKGFKKISWSTNLLGGYKYKFLSYIGKIK